MKYPSLILLMFAVMIAMVCASCGGSSSITSPTPPAPDSLVLDSLAKIPYVGAYELVSDVYGTDSIASEPSSIGCLQLTFNSYNEELQLPSGFNQDVGTWAILHGQFIQSSDYAAPDTGTIRLSADTLVVDVRIAGIDNVSTWVSPCKSFPL